MSSPERHVWYNWVPGRGAARKAETLAAGAVAGRSLWQDAWVRLRRNRAALVSLWVLGLITLAAIVLPWVWPYGYAQPNWNLMYHPPTWAGGHIFGTDALGRDLFIRVMWGCRISLMVGVVATLVTLVIGVTWGAVAGFIGGWLDGVMMRIVDILYSIPFIPFVIVLMVLFGRNLLLIFAAIGAVSWLDIARIVRGQTLSLRQREFVEAARASGVGTAAIIRRHIVPNLLGIVIVYVTLTIPAVILFEAFLSFLGLGVQAPLTSLGGLVSDGASVLQVHPYMLVIPATFLAVIVYCFNFIGDGLRDALDPKDR
ncbi:MAG: ABC transporter permease subunit [Pseudomonadota bacterium]|jgi:oligopeptide transport system permease protein|nr:ABC transporter permease subunit [Pseudomonadota bacterium]